jgi:hypothetical protein
LTSSIPQPAGWGCSFWPTKKTRRETSSNPPTGRLGIVHYSLQRRRNARPPQIPQPAGWGLFILAYKEDAMRDLLKSPNRQVGDCSLQPTKKTRRETSSNPPTGRLGIVHSGLQRRRDARAPQIPQPAGWGLFILAYKKTRRETSPNPPTGRLGIVHSGLQEDATRNLLKSPNREVRDCSFWPTKKARTRNLLKFPNRQVGDCSFSTSVSKLTIFL